jgi:hypothetical protein
MRRPRRNRPFYKNFENVIPRHLPYLTPSVASVRRRAARFSAGRLSADRDRLPVAGTNRRQPPPDRLGKPLGDEQSSPTQSPTTTGLGSALPSLSTTQMKCPLAPCWTARWGTSMLWAAWRRKLAHGQTDRAAANLSDSERLHEAETCRSADLTLRPQK